MHGLTKHTLGLMVLGVALAAGDPSRGDSGCNPTPEAPHLLTQYIDAADFIVLGTAFREEETTLDSTGDPVSRFTIRVDHYLKIAAPEVRPRIGETISVLGFARNISSEMPYLSIFQRHENIVENNNLQAAAAISARISDGVCRWVPIPRRGFSYIVFVKDGEPFGPLSAEPIAFPAEDALYQFIVEYVSSSPD
ncbi:MAG: hypothetical protein PVI23_03840 [Maricaulaceae bacterium]|jgi:hypothetical protein